MTGITEFTSIWCWCVNGLLLIKSQNAVACGNCIFVYLPVKSFWQFYGNQPGLLCERGYWQIPSDFKWLEHLQTMTKWNRTLLCVGVDTNIVIIIFMIIILGVIEPLVRLHKNKLKHVHSQNNVQKMYL